MMKQGHADRTQVHRTVHASRGHVSPLANTSNSQQQNPQAQPGGPPMTPSNVATPGVEPGQGVPYVRQTGPT